MSKKRNYNSKSNRDYQKKNSGKNMGGKKRAPKYGGKDEEMSTQNRGETYACSYAGKENDPSWYNRLRQLIQDVTKVPFNFQIGRPLEYNSNGEHTKYDNFYVPGVMALDYVICPGLAKTASDGVNIAGTGVFQRMRKDLSTYAGYAQADPMMYILAGDSMITLYNFILRCFGVINQYSGVNYNINAALLAAFGFNEDAVADFKSHINDYRSRFNNLIYKASTIFFPANFSIIDRHAWLFSNIFTDANSIKGQLYVHRPALFYILDEKGSDQGTQLLPVKFDYDPNSDTTWMNTLLDFFDEMIETVRNSDSMNKIAADLRRAYGDATSWKFAYCDEAYTVPLTYSSEVLSQIENTTILPGLDYMDEASLAVTQSVDKNILLYQPKWNRDAFNTSFPSLRGVTENGWHNNHIINAHMDNPSADDVAVMTRNMVSLTFDESSAINAWVPTALGSDYCVGATSYHYRTGNGKVGISKYNRFMNTQLMDKSPDQADFVLTRDFAEYVAYDWAPPVYACRWSENQPTNVFLTGAVPIIDYNQFTFISSNLLDSMHNNIIASMWHVPELGSIN